MGTMTTLPLKPLCLTVLPFILSVSASAKPHAKAMRTQTNQARTIHQQFAAKDATIADLRRQVRALTGQVAELNARLENMWPASTPDLTVLTNQVQDYDRLLDAARTNAVEAQKNHALQQAVSDGRTGTADSGAVQSINADHRRYAAKEAAELAAMKTSLLQAQKLYQKITASSLYESHFYETDPAVKADDASHILTFDTIGEAVHLRFIQPR